MQCKTTFLWCNFYHIFQFFTLRDRCSLVFCVSTGDPTGTIDWCKLCSKQIEDLDNDARNVLIVKTFAYLHLEVLLFVFNFFVGKYTRLKWRQAVEESFHYLIIVRVFCSFYHAKRSTSMTEHLVMKVFIYRFLLYPQSGTIVSIKEGHKSLFETPWRNTPLLVTPLELLTRN